MKIGFNLKELINMRLKSFTGNPNNSMLVDFTLEHNSKEIIMTLREKQNWPMIWGQPNTLVENWLFAKYLTLCYLAFGQLVIAVKKE
jgi:hypothetical protein